MKLLIITKHEDSRNGKMFSIVHIMEHEEGKIDYTVANADKGNNGMSAKDLENLTEYLNSLGNVHSISVELCY